MNLDGVLVQNGTLMVPIGVAGAVGMYLIKEWSKKMTEHNETKKRLLEADKILQDYRNKQASDLTDRLKATVDDMGTTVRHLDHQFASLIARLTVVEKFIPIFMDILKALKVPSSENVEIAKDVYRNQTKKPGGK